MFLSIGMLKLNYFLADIFILSAEKQPIKLSWRKIECLLISNTQMFGIDDPFIILPYLLSVVCVGVVLHQTQQDAQRVEGDHRGGQRQDLQQDRKSSRLNSSH